MAGFNNDAETATARLQAAQTDQQQRQIVASIHRDLQAAATKLRTLTAFVEDLRQITPPDIKDARRLFAAEFR